MNRPTITLAFLSLTTAALPLAAADVSVSVTPTFVSQYMFRGMRFGGPSFQPSAEVTVDKLTAGLWTSMPIADRVPGLSDPEIDPYASYTITLSESLSLEPGICVYTFPNANEAAGFYKATVEPYLGLNYTISGVTLSPKVYYDAILEGPTFEMNAAYTVPLKRFNTQLDFSASLGTYFWNNSIHGSDPKTQNYGSYYLIGVSAPYQIAEKLTATVGVAYTEGFSNYYDASNSPKEANPLATGRVVASVGLTYKF